MERGIGVSRNEGRHRESWRGERGPPIGFGESGPVGMNQPGPRMGEGGESQDTEPF